MSITVTDPFPIKVQASPGSIQASASIDGIGSAMLDAAAASAASAAASASAAAAVGSTSDTIIASRLNDTASAAFAAAKSKFASRRQAILEVNEDFTTYPDGALTVTSNAQPWILEAYLDQAVNLPRIESGSMTYDDTATDGGYATVQMDGPVTRMGAAWTFERYVPGDATYSYGAANYVNGASMAFAAFGKPIGDHPTGNPGLGPASFHLRVEPTLWALGVIPNLTDTSVTDLFIGNFSTPLAVDDTTVHRMQIAIDRDEGRAYITLPDGATYRLPPNTAFKQDCRYPFWEPYRSSGTATGKAKVLFKRAWADSHAGDVALLRREAERTAQRFIYKKIATNTSQNFTASIVEIGGAAASRIIVPNPSSGRLLFEGQVWVDNDAAFGATTRNRLYLLNDSLATLSSYDLNASPGFKGWVPFQIEYSYDPTASTVNPPGREVAYRFGILATTANTSRIRLGTVTEGVMPMTIKVSGY